MIFTNFLIKVDLVIYSGDEYHYKDVDEFAKREDVAKGYVQIAYAICVCLNFLTSNSVQIQLRQDLGRGDGFGRGGEGGRHSSLRGQEVRLLLQR